MITFIKSNSNLNNDYIDKTQTAKEANDNTTTNKEVCKWQKTITHIQKWIRFHNCTTKHNCHQHIGL